METFKTYYSVVKVYIRPNLPLENIHIQTHLMHTMCTIYNPTTFIHMHPATFRERITTRFFCFLYILYKSKKRVIAGAQLHVARHMPHNMHLIYRVTSTAE
jgi:hypothetical protein